MSILQGITLTSQSKDSMGGLKKVYIKEYEVAPEATAGHITMTQEDLAKFKVYEFRQESCSYNSEATIEDTNGVVYLTNTVELKFTKLDKQKHAEIAALLITDVSLMVQDQNGNLIYLGYDNPVSSKGGGMSSGTAFGDFSGYTITMSDMSKSLPPLVTVEGASARSI